jgi:hypothetical protein
MRSRLLLLTLSLYLAVAVLGCSKKSASDSSTSNPAPSSDSAASGGAMTPAPGSTEASEKSEKKEPTEPKEVKREPLVVPSGTSVTVSLGSSLGSKVSQPGATFSGSVAKDVLVGGDVAIPKGATVSGTVTDAKALGKFSGGAVLQVRLDSITLNGVDKPVHTALRTFSEKGKGKRTAIVTGGGAALGGIIGAIAGGGKGAAIGLAAGGGAGAGGSALTGNKDILLPAESAVTFELSQSFEVKR